MILARAMCKNKDQKLIQSKSILLSQRSCYDQRFTSNWLSVMMTGGLRTLGNKLGFCRRPSIGTVVWIFLLRSGGGSAALFIRSRKCP